MDTINTKLAMDIVSLSDESLLELEEFMYEFKEFVKHILNRKATFKGEFFDLLDLDEFIEYAKGKLEIVDKEGYAKISRRFNYSEYIKHFRTLLTEILNKDGMFQTLYFEAIMKPNNDYDLFVDYLISNPNVKDIALKNLKKIKELGIEEFTFSPERNLDVRCRFGFMVNGELSRNGKNVYGVINMLYGDGEKIWLPQIDDENYEFEEKGANYIIEYSKGTKLDKVRMILKNLEFNPNSLPTREELYDSTVLPSIDFDTIRKKTSTVDLNYAYTMTLESAKAMLENGKYLLSKLDKNDMEYVSIKNQLIQIENFMKTLDKSKKILVDNAANNGVVNPFELHQLTEKHHKLCRMPKEVRED